MNIQTWENYIFDKYNAKKITEFLQLKNYLTDEKNYDFNFTPEEITEKEIMNDEFYAAYVFDENLITNRNVVTLSDSGWKTTIIFLASTDKKTISKFFIHESNGLTRQEMKSFLKDIGF